MRNSIVRSLLILAIGFVVGCKKQNSAPATAQLLPAKAVEPQPAKVEEPVVQPGPGGGVVANPAPVLGGGGGGGAAQAVRGAVKKRAVNANHMKNIHTFIEYSSGASGKMPTTEFTYAALKQEAPETAKLVYEGQIVLCSAANREAIWAYEAEALISSGWIVSNQGVETMDAATLKQRLGR